VPLAPHPDPMHLETDPGAVALVHSLPVARDRPPTIESSPGVSFRPAMPPSPSPHRRRRETTGAGNPGAGLPIWQATGPVPRGSQCVDSSRPYK
jgi:hypothetical protein